MTVTTTLDREYFPGNGATTSFPFNFRFFTNDQIFVSLIAADGTVTPQTITTNYTLSGANSAGGGIVAMLVPPPLTTTLFVQRIVSLDQPTSIRNQGAFFPEIHENALDRLTMLIQQLAGRIGRSLEFPASDPSTISTTLPQNIARANKVLAFDSLGDPQVSNLTLSQLEQQPANAAASAVAAAASASAASDSAVSASDSSNLAQKWSSNPVDVPVTTGFFSALHWATKAAASAAAAAATLANAVLKTGAQTMAGPLTVTGGITSIPFNKEFVSTQQTIVPGGAVSVAHGLGAKPKIVVAYLVCTIATGNFSVGDETFVNLDYEQNNASLNLYGYTCKRDTTNIIVRIAQTGILLQDPVTFALINSTTVASNFKIVFQAWA